MRLTVRTFARAGTALAIGLGATPLPVAPSFAQDARPAPGVDLITPRVIADIREFLANPVVAVAVETQNERRAGVTQADIDALDRQWRDEAAGDGEQPLISATLGHPLSTYLIRVQARSLGLYSEIFVMDEHGLNVGQSSVTSDYWQGDEAKVQETFDKGSGALFIDAPEYHAETRTWRAQVSLTLEKDGAPIGASTVEINLTELARRSAQGS